MQKLREAVPTMRWIGGAAADNATWAKGCGACDCGLIAPPALASVLPLFRERCVQFEQGALKFCTCRAGQMYRRWLQTKASIEREKDNKVVVLLERERSRNGR